MPRNDSGHEDCASPSATLQRQAGRAVVRVTVVGAAVNMLLVAIKALAGLYGGSQALLADAVHSLGDLLGDLLILLGVRVWERPADAGHPHGHQRLEIVITLSLGLILAGGAVGLSWRALLDLQEVVVEPQALPWILVPVVAVVLATKEVLFRWTMAVARRHRAPVLVANAWHHRSDALGSLPVLLAVALAAGDARWAIVDPLAAMLVALLLLRVAWRIARPAFDQLIDAGASPEEVASIREIVVATAGVQEVHKIRTRHLGGARLAVDLHVLVDGHLTVAAGHDIATEVKRRLERWGPQISDVVVHVEPDDGHRDGVAELRGA